MFAWQNAPGGKPGAAGAGSGRAGGGGGSWRRWMRSSTFAGAVGGGRADRGGVKYATALFDQATVERARGATCAGCWRRWSPTTRSRRRGCRCCPRRSGAGGGGVERRPTRRSPRTVHPRAVPGAGGADARRGGAVVRGRALTYAELNARANRLAHRLRALRRGARGARGGVRWSGGGDGGRAAGRPQGRRRLRPARPGVPGRAPALGCWTTARPPRCSPRPALAARSRRRRGPVVALGDPAAGMRTARTRRRAVGVGPERLRLRDLHLRVHRAGPRACVVPHRLAREPAGRAARGVRRGPGRVMPRSPPSPSTWRSPSSSPARSRRGVRWWRAPGMAARELLERDRGRQRWCTPSPR